MGQNENEEKKSNHAIPKLGLVRGEYLDSVNGHVPD